MIAGNGGLRTGEIGKEGQTAPELIARANVAGEDEEVGRIVNQMGNQVESCLVSRGVPGAEMEIRRQGDLQRFRVVHAMWSQESPWRIPRTRKASPWDSLSARSPQVGDHLFGGEPLLGLFPVP